MKRYRTTLELLVPLTICLLVPQTALGQAERLGIVQYTPPTGFNKTSKDNVVAFSTLNQATGRFCIITVYGATAGGNPKNDFDSEWNNLVVKTLQPGANPQTETETSLDSFDMEFRA